MKLQRSGKTGHINVPQESDLLSETLTLKCGIYIYIWERQNEGDTRWTFELAAKRDSTEEEARFFFQDHSRESRPTPFHT
jgi:hypothetical protein